MTSANIGPAKTPAFFVIAFSALVLCFMGLYNNFPLLYPDTGTYIFSGFDGWMPGDRPVIYGLFVRHASLKESLWLVVYIQGLILSYVLYKLFGIFFKGRQLLCTMLVFVFAISLLTGVSVNVSQLIPDIFTPVCIIVLTLFLISTPTITKIDFGLLFAIGVLAVAVHNSHGIICLLMLSGWLIWQFIVTKNTGGLKPVLRKFFVALPMIIAGIFLNNIISLSFGNGFFPPNGSHVFIMGRLLEEGILNPYLNEKCAEKNYRICAYKDSIPTDFIWDFENSPLYKTGGWQVNQAEYRAIIIDVLTTPKYLKKLIIKSFENGLAQLCSFNTGDTPLLGAGNPAHEAIRIHYPDYIRMYELSFQNRRLLNYNFINQAQKILVLLSALFLILCFMGNTIPAEIKTLTFILVSGLVFNAMVCSTLSSIAARYESRVIWLIVIPAFILAAKSSRVQIFFKNSAG